MALPTLVDLAEEAEEDLMGLAEEDGKQAKAEPWCENMCQTFVTKRWPSLTSSSPSLSSSLVPSFESSLPSTSPPSPLEALSVTFALAVLFLFRCPPRVRIWFRGKQKQSLGVRKVIRSVRWCLPQTSEKLSQDNTHASFFAGIASSRLIPLCVRPIKRDIQRQFVREAVIGFNRTAGTHRVIMIFRNGVDRHRG